MLEPIIEEDEDKTVEIHTTQNTINLLKPTKISIGTPKASD